MIAHVRRGLRWWLAPLSANTLGENLRGLSVLAALFGLTMVSLYTLDAAGFAPAVGRIMDALTILVLGTGFVLVLGMGLLLALFFAFWPLWLFLAIVNCCACAGAHKE